METIERKAHWEKIYSTKHPNEVSWFQEIPSTSIGLIKELNLPSSAKIFDNGGGDGKLVDHLLDMGFENITVLDISSHALEKAKQRLGDKAQKVNWVIADEAHCDIPGQYDVWHDRAAFHFLTEESDIENYINTIQKCIKPGGYFIVGTFSDQGPKKCSGLEIKQYSEKSLTEKLQGYFEKIKCFTIDHHTPFSTTQNFLFCTFKRMSK
ncbi:MAG TPA: class I SAM-dependent methyltransferase [Chitinophagales bacterium]|nr:class I SAM-dependent methyltransferase [Chitinophagales bacterium]